MEFIREDCIYARQSVDRKDSISIESQIDFCKYELKGGSCRVFKDKGYSGKNTDRPEFQKLLGEIRKGKVRRVIVYKLDRISRSILDFATMMELFQEYDVEFVSSTEKFDTSTPMGRAMLNICIVFAQLERETIQKRVTDAYYSRCLKGFHMSGQAPYGYHLEPTVVEGIRTKKMVADPVAADHVRLKRQAYIKKKIRDKENQAKREEEQSNFGAEENTVWDRLEVQNEELVAAVQQLKPKARFIVTGYVLKGKTFKELAQETKLTERAAASTYYRSIEKLRIKMEKEK